MENNIFAPDFERPIRIPGRIRLKRAKPEIVFAGKKTTLRLSFEIPINVKSGEILKIQLFGGRNNKGTIVNLQTSEPEKDGFISVRCNGSPLKISQKNIPYGTITIFPQEKEIKKGTKIDVVIKNARFEQVRLLNKFFVLYKDDLNPPAGPHRAESVWNVENQKKILDACVLHILGGKIDHIKVYNPSIVLPGQKFSILIRPQDRFFNLSSEILNEKIEFFDGKTILKGKIKKIKNSNCLLFKTSLEKPGIYRLTVHYGRKKFTGNPIICSSNERFNLYWGMIHGHTEMSDGAGTIEYYFHQLKNEAGLDFGAPGDHDHTWETTDKMWRKICNTVKKWNSEGKFVTFLGYEWAKWRRNGDGDRNVYYFYDDRPIYRSDDGCYPNPKALFEALKKEKAIIIPHHTAHGGNFCDWKDHNKEKERLIEIYQERGSYECSEKDGNPVPECKSNWEVFEKGYVVNALLSGWRAGFTGGGDDHIAHAGTDFPHGSCNYKDGLTGVFARNLTRKGIWEALWNRRTIATTGARIYLFYTVNGYPLGSEILSKDAQIRNFHIVFHGTDVLDRIEIIRNGKVVETIKEQKMDLQVYWQDSTPLKNLFITGSKHSKKPFVFYYIRLIQKNKEAVWASPVWIIRK